MIDFHNHLLPGVDDGAANLEEAIAAARAMADAGVREIVVTPHLQASLTERPAHLATVLGRLDQAFESLRDAMGRELPEVGLGRAVELMLDTPRLDLSDPRLRIAGTDSVLVEFPWMAVPPYGTRILGDLKRNGWTPVVAHPERYAELGDLGVLEEWRDVGCGLQVNYGSLVGRYGKEVRTVAWRLLERGWVDYLSSDYHARGPLRIADAREALEKAGAEVQMRLLCEENPRRLLAGEPPLPVPAIRARSGVLQRLLGSFRRGSAEGPTVG